MRIEDILYFAPGIQMSTVAVGEKSLVEHVLARLRGFYIDPSKQLNKMNHIQRFWRNVISVHLIPNSKHVTGPPLGIE
jgi:hypothetical protein